MKKKPQEILIRPIITEKTTLLKDQARVAAFEVALHANKIEIRHAVEKQFGVKVDRVHILPKPRKMKRWGRFEGYTSKGKKAYVFLRKGEKLIEFLEGV